MMTPKSLLFWRRRHESANSNEKDLPKQPSFPTRQMFVLALCRICEPIAFMSIFPYIYYMIKSFNITDDDKQIAVYAGMVTSAFAFAEFSTGVVWGKLSDTFGRKPILLTGMAGTGVSMLIFGFARNLQLALFARALGGLLNGNMGVLQTTVAELVRDDSHRPRAYAVMPFVWCLGGIIGAGLGGCLSDPVNNLNFGSGTIFETYPYLLPNVVCTGVVIISVTIGILFIEETHETKKHQRDLGRKAGNWILARLGLLETKNEVDLFAKVENEDEESAALMSDKSLYEATESFAYDSAGTTPRASQEVAASKEMLDDEALAPKKLPGGTLQAFNGQVLLNVIAYGIVAYHTITLDQLLPVLLSMDESDAQRSLPFKFVGGFQLPSTTIGFILSLQGIYQMAAQLILFPWIVKRLGNLKTFRVCAFTYPLLYFCTPYLVLLSGPWRMAALFFILVWKVTLQSMVYPSNMLLLTNNTPSLLVLGAINGVAASAASLARAIGPTLSGLIETAGLSSGYAGLPFWVSALVACLGAAISTFMRDLKMEAEAAKKQQRSHRQDSEELGEDDEVSSRLSGESGDTLVEQQQIVALPK